MRIKRLSPLNKKEAEGDNLLGKQGEQKSSWNEEESDNKPTWELVREFIQKFGRMPKDEDELNSLVQYVIDNKNK